MVWEFSIFSGIIFGGAGLALIVGAGSLRKRPDPMAIPLAVLMGAAAAWAIPHAISLGFSDVSAVAFWHRLRYPGTVATPLAYLVVTLRYAGHEDWLSGRVWAGLLVIPALTIVAVWTNSFHGLFWESIAIERLSTASVFAPVVGPLYWVNLVYLYGLALTGLAILGRMVRRSGPIYRKQAVLMFLGGVVPLATNAVVTFGSGPAAMIDLTTAAMALSGATFALALFHFDLLDISPVARNNLFEELEDGVIVVGPNDEIRDYNTIAAQAVGDLAVHQPIDEVFPADIATDGGELIAKVDGRQRHYQTRTTTLTDQRGRPSGTILYLNDVTDIAAREQRISVLNRILRHNIRNELNVVSGRLEILADQVSDRNREHIMMASKYTRQVIAYAEKARTIERTLRAEDRHVVIAPQTVVEAVVDDARAQYPDADIDLVTPADCPTIRVIDEALIEQAFTELIDNAIVHADDDPRVTITFRTDHDMLTIAVADTCPAIPETEITALESQTETELEHSRGLGLWLVKWAVSLSAGTLSFDRNQEGNVVTLSFPIA